MGSELDGASINAVATLAKDSVRASIIEAKGERTGVYYLVGPAGVAEKKVADPGWHKESLATPTQLLAFVEAEKKDRSALFLNENEVTFVRDLDDRRDVSACKLTYTPQYRWLTGESGKQLTQPDLVRVLRITLRGALPADSTLLTLIRKLKFQNDKGATGDIQHGRESLGRSITASINADNELPDELTLRVPIFENHPFIAPIVCAIEIFPHESMFKLTPYPLELRKAMDGALDSIAQTLAPAEVPTYLGQP